jgi:multiple sugar transport system substrate-binding protein
MRTTPPLNHRRRRNHGCNALVGGALVAGLFAAACSGGDDSSATTAAPGTTAAAVTSAAPDTAAPDTVAPDTSAAPETTLYQRDPLTLTLWSSFSDTEGTAAFQPMIDRCESMYPWMTIEYVGKDGISDSIQAAVEAGSPPDLIQADFSGGLAYLEAGGIVEPIDDLFARDGLSWDSFVPGGKRLVEFKDQHWGLPLSLDPVGLFYNGDALAEAGITEPPSNYDELLDAAKKLLKVGADGSVERVGFVPDVGDGSYVSFIAYLFGGQRFNDDGSEVTIATPEWAESLRWQQQYYDLMDPEAFQRWGDGLGSYDSADNFFIKGDLAMYLEASYFITWPDRFGNGKPENWGVVPFPTPDGVADPNDLAPMAGGNGFFIPTGVQDREASWAALSCLALGGEQIAAFENVIGNIPTNVDALALFEQEQVAKIPEYQAFIDLVRSPNAEVSQSSLVSNSIGDRYTALALDYRRGDIADDELENALADLQASLQEELDLELGS